MAENGIYPKGLKDTIAFIKNADRESLHKISTMISLRFEIINMTAAMEFSVGDRAFFYTLEKGGKPSRKIRGKIVKITGKKIHLNCTFENWVVSASMLEAE